MGVTGDKSLGFEKYRRVINSSPQAMQESDFEQKTDLEHEPRMSWSKVASECSNSTDCPFRRRYNVFKGLEVVLLVNTMLRFSAIVWNAQAAKVCQAADNCDITMVAALRLSDTSIQHVGHQGARLTASRGVYFRSSGKLFTGAIAIAPLKT